MLVQSIPYPANAGPAGDITIAVQDFQTGTTVTTLNHPSATLSGITPKAALIFGNQHVVANEPSATGGASLTISLCLDGSGAGRAVRTFNEHNQAATDVKRVQWLANSFFQLFNNTGDNFDIGGTPALVSGGIDIDYGRANNNRRLVYVAFAGADLQRAGGSINLGTGTSAISVSTGFEPDAVIFFGIMTSTDNALENFFTYTMGFASWDGTTLTQRMVGGIEADALADSAPFQVLSTDKCAAQIAADGSAFSYGVAASNFTSSGFDVTPSASAGSDRLHYLALNFGGRRTKIVDFTTPTSTGDFSVVGAGFTPSFALAITTALEGVDPSFPLTSSDNMSGFAICCIGSDEQWSVAMRVDALAATTATSSIVRNAALLAPSATSTLAFEASFVGWDADGATFNASAVHGTGKKFTFLFVE